MMKERKFKMTVPNNVRVNRFKAASSALLNLVQDISCNIKNEADVCGANKNQRNVSVIQPKALSSSTHADLAESQETGSYSMQNNDHNKDLVIGKEPASENSSKTSYTSEGTKTFSQDNSHLEVISMMYQLHREREKELEETNIALNQHLRDQLHGVCAKDVLLRRFNMIQNLNLHLSKIISEAMELKQKLRKPIYQDVWDIHISHHKFIVEFFEIAGAMIAGLENNIETLDWNCKQNMEQSFNMKQLLLMWQTVIAHLEKSSGSLEEFRSTLSSVLTQKNCELE